MDAAENRERLFALDESLRAEADLFLKDSGLGKIIREEGYKSVGSYAIKTMVWRNLDYERCDESPDWDEHWELGKRFDKTGWVWSAHALNAYIDPRQKDYGHYWGLQAARPGEKDYWKLDLWTCRAEEYAPFQPRRDLWQSRLNDNNRYEILVIKEAVCSLPEYGKRLRSVHIYEAVLEQGIRGVDAFMRWWKSQYGK